VLVNNAGYGLNGRLKLDMLDLRREFETNVFGLAVRMAQLVLPSMRAS